MSIFRISMTFLMVFSFSFNIFAADSKKEDAQVKKITEKVSEKPKTVSANSKESQEEVEEEPKKPITGKVFLFTKKSAPGKTHYDIGLRVNGERVRVLFDKETALNIEITKFFHVGENEVVFFAVKQPKKGKVIKGKSSDFFKVLLLKAKINKGALEVEDELISYTRKGSEVKRFVNKFILELD